MKITSSSVLAAFLAVSSQICAFVQAQAPINDQCWDPIQITCGNTYSGSTITATPSAYTPGTCAAHSSEMVGVWYKLSTGGDTFQLTLDNCNANYDSYVSLYTGPCSELDQNVLTCVAGNDDACSLQSIVGPLSASADEDYWIFVHGWANRRGEFDLDVICDALPASTATIDPLGPIDPWFIQRSAFPAPDVTNVDPLDGGVWLELHPDRVPDLSIPTFIPALTATAHQIVDGEPCASGDVIPAVTFSNEACTPNSNGCPELMNPPSVAVKQTFVILDPYNVPNIWLSPSPGANDGQFQFCVHTILKLDYDQVTSGEEEVSYFDTYYIVEVDYTTGFMLNVAALERNPQEIETLFDSFQVNPYLCDDGNVDNNLLNDPLLPPAPSHEFFVGENFRFCITPAAGFENFVVSSFNDVTCYNAGDSRLVIANGVVPGPEVELTVIDALAPPTGGVAFESTVTSGFLMDNSLQYFVCSGTVEMAPARRFLQEGEPNSDEDFLTGSFSITMTIVQPDEGLLSTGAIVGIVAAAFAAFLVMVLILYRRGCFDKRNKDVPKTVGVDESSETTGDAQGDGI